MKKLIKINEQHYVIIDDSEILDGDFYYDSNLKLLKKTLKIVIKEDANFEDRIYYDEYFCSKLKFCSKVLYSTLPLENVSLISLEDVEEAINGYSLESIMSELVNEKANKNNTIDLNAYASGILKGLEYYKELTKNNLFTINDMKKALNMAQDTILMDLRFEDKDFKYTVEEIIESLLPKTEWNIDVIDDKIILL